MTQAQVLESLSKDIILFIPGANAKNVEGKSAVRNFWFPPSNIHYPIRKYEISDQHLFGSGIYATAQGRSLFIWDTMKADSLISTDTAWSEYLTILRKDDREWKIFRNTYQTRNK